jgi:nucleolar pre-ribosomal-associated protein 1
MQLGDVIDMELIAWLRILENVVFLADTSKLERASGNEWYAPNQKLAQIVVALDVPTYSACHIDKNLSILNQSVVIIVRPSLILGIPDRPLRQYSSTHSSTCDIWSPRLTSAAA